MSKAKKMPPNLATGKNVSGNAEPFSPATAASRGSGRLKFTKRSAFVQNLPIEDAQKFNAAPILDQPVAELELASPAE